jgi:mono/diheme cytochrome c family protein
MTKNDARPSLFAPLGGVVVGLAVFLGVNITTGRAIIPTAASITNKKDGLSDPVRPADEAATAAPPGGPYETVCITCHQAEGQGIAGAFPPLAGSEWLLGNPEIPVRVVILGLTGPIEVKGTKFNSTMPPPPGLTDEKIAEAITYARSHFGNHGPKVDVELVKKERAMLAGRTASCTMAELAGLQAAQAGSQEGSAAGATAPGGTGAVPEATAPTAKGPVHATGPRSLGKTKGSAPASKK